MAATLCRYFRICFTDVKHDLEHAKKDCIISLTSNARWYSVTQIHANELFNVKEETELLVASDVFNTITFVIAYPFLENAKLVEITRGQCLMLHLLRVQDCNVKNPYYSYHFDGTIPLDTKVNYLPRHEHGNIDNEPVIIISSSEEEEESLETTLELDVETSFSSDESSISDTSCSEGY